MKIKELQVSGLESFTGMCRLSELPPVLRCQQHNSNHTVNTIRHQETCFERLSPYYLRRYDVFPSMSRFADDSAAEIRLIAAAPSRWRINKLKL